MCFLETKTVRTVILIRKFSNKTSGPQQVCQVSKKSTAAQLRSGRLHMKELQGKPKEQIPCGDVWP